ncbi:hypothetical protein IQ07DRAFT_588996 [Pyrenochaeta sp. DS3sAY3a]|nr:hypothetical protein IQ07DRAFT_588996 [Pyrenochaeta sp. DS3sAY3a]
MTTPPFRTLWNEYYTTILAAVILISFQNSNFVITLECSWSWSWSWSTRNVQANRPQRMPRRRRLQISKGERDQRQDFDVGYVGSQFD